MPQANLRGNSRQGSLNHTETMLIKVKASQTSGVMTLPLMRNEEIKEHNATFSDAKQCYSAAYPGVFLAAK
jgi:hypothetical protein